MATFADLNEQVDRINDLFTPRRKRDPRHFEIETANRRARLVRWKVGTSAEKLPVTDYLQPSDMEAYLDAFRDGLVIGREKGIQRGMAKHARSMAARAAKRK